MIRQVSEWSDDLRKLQVFSTLSSGEEARAACAAGADGAAYSCLETLVRAEGLWTLREALFEKQFQSDSMPHLDSLWHPV